MFRAATTTHAYPPEADASTEETADADGAETSSSSDDQQHESTDADVTAEEATQTRASDAALDAKDTRAAREAERHDVQSGPSSPPPGINPMALRQPPVPDDEADGNIHIRFKHPE